MATATMAWFGKAVQKLVNGELDLNAGSYKIGLVATAYTPNVDTNEFWSTPEADEVTGTNWAAGGVATTVTTDLDTANNRVRLFCSDINVATVTLTDGKHLVLYKVLGGASSADPLVGYGTFDTALAPTAGTLAIDFDGTLGALRITY